MTELILAIDEDDNFLREEEKMKCHLGDGILHRAITVMVVDSKGRYLVTKRSSKKMLWPDYWDGSISSHQHKDETDEESVRRRVKQELGVDCKDVEFVLKMKYHSKYKDIGSEKEIDYFFLVNGIDEIKPNPNEISEYKFLTLDELKRDISINRSSYGPWFPLIFDKWL
jgi:isopentenyl-diphosphate delta-isomerase